MRAWIYSFVRRHKRLSGAVAFLTIVLLVWFWPVIVGWTDAHEGLAAWVQAIGVIGAIAIPLVWAAGAKAREVRAAEQRLMYRGGALVLQIREYLQSLSKWSAEGEIGKITQSDCTPEQGAVLAAQLENLPVLDLPDYSMAAALIALMAKMNHIASILVDPPVPDGIPRRGPYVQDLRRAAVEVVTPALNDCDDFDRSVQDYYARGGPWTPDGP